MKKKVKRNKEIKVRLTEQELSQLNEAANLCLLSREAYIRMRLQNYLPKPAPSNELIELLNQLRKIGINMNQIAYKANSLGIVDDTYSENVKELQEQVINMKKLLFEPERDEFSYGCN